MKRLIEENEIDVFIFTNSQVDNLVEKEVLTEAGRLLVSHIETYKAIIEVLLEKDIYLLKE